MTKERVKTGGETKTNASSCKESREDKLVLISDLFLGTAEEKRSHTKESDATCKKGDKTCKTIVSRFVIALVVFCEYQAYGSRYFQFRYEC